MKAKFPSKKLTYRHCEGGVWEIWSGEDFSEGTVTLYERETGEDWTGYLEDFYKCFTPVKKESK